MKILIVEDDVFFQKFYSTKLKEKGFEVFIAGDGEEGMQKVKEIKPSVILLDIIMPKKDGFEVLESLGKDPVLRTIPVLVFSTLGQTKEAERAKKLGARDYVNKTFFDFDRLLAKIAEVTKK